MRIRSRLPVILMLVACSSSSGGDDDRDAGPGIPPPTWRADAATADGGSPPSSDGGGDRVDAFVPPSEDLGPPDPECISGSATWSEFTASAADPSRQVRLPLEVGVPYRTLTVELEVEPGQWQPDCWNPASGRWMSPFQVLLDVRRGSRFCKGGNLIGMTARGGRNDDLWIQSFYSETVVSRGCTGSEHQILGSRPNSPLELGTSVPVRMHMDTVTRAVDIEVGSVMRSGTMDPDLEIRSTAAADFFLVTSLELFLECYAPDGGEGETCCHVPSVGWTYRNLRYTACR